MEDMERLHRLRQRQDWFRPAMENNGSLASCLDEVIKIQDAKLHFVACIKAGLCTQSAQASDRVTELRHHVYNFSRTLDLRLGVLAFDRPAAWFQQLDHKELGPFPGSIQLEPVFLPFEPMQAKVLKVELKTAWTQKHAAVRSFEAQTANSCLWLSLLDLNQRWEKLCELSSPYADLRLDELPEALPDELYSDALQAFLHRVKGAISACRQDLDQCFDRLWKASDLFLAKQFMDACQKQQRHSQGSSYRKAASYANSGLTESLAFMQLSALPSRDVLRRRFRDLAKRYHPDASSGCEEKFKSLNHHYRELLLYLGEHPEANGS